MILASGADLQSPNPLLTTHPLARQIQRYALLVTLVRYDSALTPAPYLARSWTWSADSTVLTMRLFSGLAWHDGTPTTARDAQWTLDAARDSAGEYPRRRDLAGLIDVAAPDDTTLLLRFSRPTAKIPDVLTDLALLPRHLLDTAARSGGLRQAEWNRRPVGNGPFRFVAYEANRRWVFEANPDFPAGLGGPPRLDRFVVAVVDEPTTKLAALTSGELDLAGINPAHAQFVRKNPRLAVLDYPLLFSYALIFNTRKPPFDRLEARQRVTDGLDRQAVVDGVLFGFGTPATGPLPPALSTSAVIAAPPSAVVPSRRRGIPSPDAGAPLAFEMLTVGSGEAALEQMLQSQLAAHGITAKIRQLELSTFLDRVEGGAREFDAAVLGISGDLALGHLARILGIAGFPPEGTPEELAGTIQDSVAAAFLYHARGVQGVNRRVKGITMDLRGELVTLSQWWVEDQ
ncbi:MAG TPA: ABC transporter substrate-binding protein [Gemmatimonadales bacterium]|nr:ABC transporter substrate-binding protein [Gemmatimonadales bacterium]